MTCMHANETPAHQMHARGMHAREIQINHTRPYTGGRFVEIGAVKYEFLRWLRGSPPLRAARAYYLPYWKAAY